MDYAGVDHGFYTMASEPNIEKFYKDFVEAIKAYVK